MASSSTRTTEIEATLRTHFKTTFAWLWITQNQLHAERTGQLFADALEMRWPELLDLLKPGMDLTANKDVGKNGERVEVRAEFRSGVEYWGKMQQKRCKLARSAQISLAGDALCDAAVALVGVGRAEEAGGFWEAGQMVCNLSREADRRECELDLLDME